MSLVSIRNISKRYGEHEVLRGVDLEIEPGQVVAVIGRSGSGKSTLLRCINGLETLDGGSIVVDGQQVSQRARELRALHRKIGIVFQSFNLFPHMSALQNVMLGPVSALGVPKPAARAHAEEMLRLVGLGDRMDNHPARLSGGQQQRVAIARALAMQPALLLFDEVTSALDPELTEEVVRVLESLADQGRTMLLVTHEIAFARSAADVLVFMHGGKIWEQGPPESLLDNPRTDELKKFLSAILR